MTHTLKFIDGKELKVTISEEEYDMIDDFFDDLKFDGKIKDHVLEQYLVFREEFKIMAENDNIKLDDNTEYEIIVEYPMASDNKTICNDKDMLSKLPFIVLDDMYAYKCSPKFISIKPSSQ